MDTSLRFAGILLVTAVLVVAALLLVPGLGGPAPAPNAVDPSGSVGSPMMPVDPGYWTPERMAEAEPMPMPTPR